MSAMSSTFHPPAVRHMAEHILNCLREHRSRFAVGIRCPPLFVGVQGPQGSGKTFLTSRLREQLGTSPHSLTVSVLSIDDIYLPHDGLTALARAHPQNRLLQGRGQPGTHDLTLGNTLLRNIRRINDSVGGTTGVELPVFDKSLFGGEGDRLPRGMLLRPPVDVFILEGWCLGFYPTNASVIEERWNAPVPELEDCFDMKSFVRIEDVLAINDRLKAYVEWWEMLDAFIQIKGTSSYKIIYKWRLQQEHDMKARNGGRGMTDEQVKAFVDRYIPGYVFFADGVTTGSGERGRTPRWIGNGLAVVIGPERELIHTSKF
ncbi:P-loop containing nucleoside triphosphate hydrolase protein [Scleroderma yunnanense]